MGRSDRKIVVVPFSKLREVEEELIGSKAANLGRLVSLRVPVPNGLVITTYAFDHHLLTNNLFEFIQKELASLDPADSVRLENASKRIRSGIVKMKMAKDLQKAVAKAYASLSGFTDAYVAIRSSSLSEKSNGTSKQFATFLNVKGKEDVIEKVRLCWASLFSPQNLFYALSREQDVASLKMAVIIQKMVQAEVSGIMFTLNPIDNDESKVSIEAVLGLGEALVNGQLTPDTYLINKEEGEILEKHIVPQEWMLVRKGRVKKGEDPNVKVKVGETWRTREKLENKNIEKLLKLGKAIEDQFKQSQEIEWTLEGGKIWIVQTRPVVDLKVEEESWKKTPTLAALKAKVSASIPRTALSLKDKIRIIPAKGKEQKKDSDRPKVNGDVLLTGTSAQKGIASGRVSLVNSPKQLKGDDKMIALVAPSLTPAYEGKLDGVVAIVTDDGGSDSYAATLAQRLTIPCIIDTQIATKALKAGEFVTVDGNLAKVVLGATEEGINAAEKLTQKQNEDKIKVESSHKDKGVSKDYISQDIATSRPIKTATNVFVNIDDPYAISNEVSEISDGVGFVNFEHLICEFGVHPQLILKRKGGKEDFVKALSLGLFKIAKAFDPKSAIYKLSNISSSDYLKLQGGSEFEVSEANPFMGMRGASRFLENPDEAKLELEAVKNVRNKENLRNVWVAIPFVRTYRELREMKHLISGAGFKRSSTFKLFFVIEVPSAVIRVEKFLDLGIDGVIIDIDSLSQLLLGVDKGNPKLQGSYKDSHLAVKWAVERIVKACNKAKVHSIIKGQVISSKPQIIKDFVEWGVTSISVNPDVVEQSREFVAEAEKKLLSRKRR